MALVRAVGRLPAAPRVQAEQLYDQLYADKKKQDADLYFVLPRRVGRVEIVSRVPRAAVLASLAEVEGILPAR